MKKKTLTDIDVAGKTVLVRVDFNVPFLPGTTEISDDSRVAASLPTIRYLTDRRCKVVLCSHLGRPKGRVVEELRMGPVSRRLSELLGTPVAQTPDCVGPKVRTTVENLPSGGVAMLENLRFHPEEEADEPSFARELASMAGVYVNDAFGTAHRAHASTQGVARFLPAVAGLLMERELRMLGAVLESPRRPCAVILGGAKVSDKMAALGNLAEMADVLAIGGGMAALFLKVMGHDVGQSPVEEDQLPAAERRLRAADRRGLDVLLPVDAVVADAFSASADHRVVELGDVPAPWRIMDIGPRTAERYENAVRSARTVVWNGPMGVAEWAPFAEGTARIASALAGLNGSTTVIGGGSTAEIVIELGLADKMTHVSTGGGATLEFLEGRSLAGVAALMDKEN